MTNRAFAISLLVTGMVLFTPVVSAEDSDWTLPRTPWGHPDLQGMWTNETITPFERPAEQEGQDSPDRRRSLGNRGQRRQAASSL